MYLYVTVTKLLKYSHYEHVRITFFAVDRPKHKYKPYYCLFLTLHCSHADEYKAYTRKSVSVNLSSGHSYKACDQKSLFSVGLHRKG